MDNHLRKHFEPAGKKKVTENIGGAATLDLNDLKESNKADPSVLSWFKDSR